MRYGRENNYVTNAFTDGVECGALSFGVDRINGAKCWYDPAPYVPPSEPNPSPDAGALPTDPTDPHEHTGGSGGAGGTGMGGMGGTDMGSTGGTGMGGMGGTDMGSTGGTDTGGMGGTDMGSTGGTDMGGMGGMGGSPTMPSTGGTGGHPHGPYIDTSLIPTGSAGFSDVRIGTTSEQPAPGDGTGAFRTVCEYSHMNFDDPIVFPGQPGASHLHTFFGNTGTNSASTQSSLRNSGNSTCRGGIANRSAYWAPSLIDTSEGRPIAPVEMHAYYKTGYNGVAPASVQPFPDGLRLLGGSPRATEFQPMAYWSCLAVYTGHHAQIPECPAGTHVQMTVVFPQCWDGQHLDSADHRSHMAYPSNGCPATHPVPIPEISINLRYLVPPEGVSSWRLASDDLLLPPGYSVHGDYFEAWDPAVVETFVRHCDNPALDCHSHLLGDGRTIY